MATDTAKQAKAEIAQAAADALKVISSAAADALKVVDVKNAGDHDLLIELKTKLDDLKSDIKEIKDGTAAQIADHEKRIKDTEISLTQIKTYGAALLIILGLTEFVILKFVK